MTLRQEAAVRIMAGSRFNHASQDASMPFADQAALAVDLADALVAKLGEGKAQECGTCAHGSTVNENWRHCLVFCSGVHATMSCPSWKARP